MGNEEVEAANVFVRLGSVVATNHPQISVPYIASFLYSMSWVECATQSLGAQSDEGSIILTF